MHQDASAKHSQAATHSAPLSSKTGAKAACTAARSGLLIGSTPPGAAGWWRGTRRATSTWWSPSGASRRRTSLRSRWRWLALRASHTRTSAAACVPSTAASSSEGRPDVLLSVQGSCFGGQQGSAVRVWLAWGFIHSVSYNGLHMSRTQCKLLLAWLTMLVLCAFQKATRLSPEPKGCNGEKLHDPANTFVAGSTNTKPYSEKQLDMGPWNQGPAASPS